MISTEFNLWNLLCNQLSVGHLSFGKAVPTVFTKTQCLGFFQTGPQWSVHQVLLLPLLALDISICSLLSGTYFMLAVGQIE